MRGLARVGDLIDGLGGGGIEHDVVGGAGLRHHLCHASSDVPTGRREAGDTQFAAARAVTAAGGFQRIDHIIGGDDTQPGAACGRALHIPCRRHDQAGFAVARQDDGRGPQGLEAAQHEHRIGGLDEMRAVMDGDQRLELVLDHAGADGGGALVESHGVLLGFLLRSITAWTRGTKRGAAG
jgi:hypothetical protein